MEIALKECHESEYWLDLLFETGYIDEITFNRLKTPADLYVKCSFAQ
jgi:four helix bundle protein